MRVCLIVAAAVAACFVFAARASCDDSGGNLRRSMGNLRPPGQSDNLRHSYGYPLPKAQSSDNASQGTASSGYHRRNRVYVPAYPYYGYGSRYGYYGPSYGYYPYSSPSYGYGYYYPGPVFVSPGQLYGPGVFIGSLP